jgi:hypothetical protein
MAKLNFRQGLVRYQTDVSDNPAFLIQNGSYVDLNVSPDPTVFTIAHFDQDYLFAENEYVAEAWGPFSVGPNHYLYWDVNLTTGELTRGFTTVAPTYGPTPPSPLPGYHWFDTTSTVMKVWSGSNWVEKLRVFAAIVGSGAPSITYPYELGESQVGLDNTPAWAGYPLFDGTTPVQRFRRDRRGVFVHTETPLSSPWTRLTNFKIEATIMQARATEHIPMHYAVSYQGPNKIGLASSGPQSSPLINSARPAIGIAAEDMYTGEERAFITKGYVSNEQWNWTEPSGTYIFVGLGGVLTTAPPQYWSIQRIGNIVDSNTIYLNVEQMIRYV